MLNLAESRAKLPVCFGMTVGEFPGVHGLERLYFPGKASESQRNLQRQDPADWSRCQITDQMPLLLGAQMPRLRAALTMCSTSAHQQVLPCAEVNIVSFPQQPILYSVSFSLPVLHSLVTSNKKGEKPHQEQRPGYNWKNWQLPKSDVTVTHPNQEGKKQ